MVIYQQLQTIAPRIAEQENVAALRIAAQMVAHQPAAAARRAPARCPYLYRQQSIACPACLILGTLFSQMTIESTSRDPSTAAELTLLHAARCKLRYNL